MTGTLILEHPIFLCLISSMRWTTRGRLFLNYCSTCKNVCDRLSIPRIELPFLLTQNKQATESSIRACVEVTLNCGKCLCCTCDSCRRMFFILCQKYVQNKRLASLPHFRLLLLVWLDVIHSAIARRFNLHANRPSSISWEKVWGYEVKRHAFVASRANPWCFTMPWKGVRIWPPFPHICG